MRGGKDQNLVRSCPGCLGIGAPGISIARAGFYLGNSTHNSNLGRRFALTGEQADQTFGGVYGTYGRGLLLMVIGPEAVLDLNSVRDDNEKLMASYHVPSLSAIDRESFEKFIVDVELVQMLQAEFTPLEIDEDSLAFGAHQEVGHGGHFLGAMHTMERFRTCFYRPMLSSSDNYERWVRNGGNDTNARATKIYQQKLEEYVAPPLDDAVRLELQEYVVRRRRELGD